MVRKFENRLDSRSQRWFRHMVRMDDERLVRRAMKEDLSGCRPRGRPKLVELMA